MRYARRNGTSQKRSSPIFVTFIGKNCLFQEMPFCSSEFTESFQYSWPHVFHSQTLQRSFRVKVIRSSAWERESYLGSARLLASSNCHQFNGIHGQSWWAEQKFSPIRSNFDTKLGKGRRWHSLSLLLPTQRLAWISPKTHTHTIEVKEYSVPIRTFSIRCTRLYSAKLSPFQTLATRWLSPSNSHRSHAFSERARALTLSSTDAAFGPNYKQKMPFSFHILVAIACSR